jgi:hypothetical protein
MRWEGNIACTQEVRNAYKEGKRPLGRLRSRWEGNIRTNFREIGWEGVDWLHLAQDRWHLVNVVMNFQVP